MSYSEIVNLVFTILSLVYALLVIHFVIFGVIGIFHHKRFPVTAKINNYGVIIAARNEEKVIANLIRSVQTSYYPQDKLHIFVVAHNCTDLTAEVARKHGAVVYEYNDPNKCRKSYALNYIFKKIKEDYDTKQFAGFFVFDVDNTMRPNYFHKMNDAFEYYHREHTIASYRNYRYFGRHIIADSYALMHSLTAYVWARGRTTANCSTRVFGTGFLIPTAVLEAGWNFFIITEDYEFTNDQILHGHNIMFCDEAEFFDDQPSKFSTMFHQRLRWERGLVINFGVHGKELFKKIFAKSVPNRGSIYDAFMTTMPLCLVTFFLLLAQGLVLLFSPLAGVSLSEAFLHWTSFSQQPFAYELFMNMAMLQNVGFLYVILRSLVLLYLSIFLVGTLVLFICHRRYAHISWWKVPLLLLVFPLFMIFQWPLDIVALLTQHRLPWHSVSHQR